MRILKLTKETQNNILENLLKRSPNSYGEFESRVNDIIQNVREKRDEAIFEYTLKFDGATIDQDNICVTEEEIKEAYEQVDPKLLDVIRKALVNIRDYHAKQKQYSWFDSDESGIILGQKVTPLKTVGVYVPGGKAVYPSSVLMNVIPAKVAGVSNIIMTTPCGKDGKVYPSTLVAAKEAGYICSMLFIIPGFPFITSGIDLAKLDMRSGLERLAYAILIILVATLTAWIMAMLLHLQPVQFPPLSLTIPEEIVLRLLASFGGVFGFSLMFNSPRNLAVCAALIGAVTNTFRLELVSLAGFPPAVAAFLGALLSGLLATCLKNAAGYPRISVTVPSIVIMVPGLYFYRAIYNLGIMSLTDSATWFADAILIIVALPLGLIFARIITDRTFRYCT